MRETAKKHPVITALLLLAIALFLFTIYIFKSTTRNVTGVALSIGERIAVIEINGVILDSKEIIDRIDAVRRNDSVKAVSIRVDSPGGGVAPAQEIYSEIRKLRKKKKVVASLASIAASGGYYVASAAEKIVANPGTLTGSIGVIMDFSNIEGLLEKIGLKGYVIKSGRFKDIGSPLREMTDDEKRLLQEVIDNVHSQFVDAVAEGRKMDRDEVAAIADGRILSGEQALMLGLVDSLGNLQDAVKIAAEMAGIRGEPKVFYQGKRKGLLDYLLGGEVATLLQNLSVPQLMYRIAYL